GRFFGEVHFGHTTQVVLGGIEGLLFGSCVVGALVLARRAGLPGALRGGGRAAPGGATFLVPFVLRESRNPPSPTRPEMTIAALALRLAALAALLLAVPFPTSAQDVRWARSGGGTGVDGDYGARIAVDAAGNAYVTGRFDGAATFGGTVLTGYGAFDAFVVKYDPEGAVLWARHGGSDGSDQAEGIAVDAAGNAYVTGQFEGTATFGTFSLTSVGSTDVFVVKYSPAGDVLWARRG